MSNVPTTNLRDSQLVLEADIRAAIRVLRKIRTAALQGNAARLVEYGIATPADTQRLAGIIYVWLVMLDKLPTEPTP